MAKIPTCLFQPTLFVLLIFGVALSAGPAVALPGDLAAFVTRYPFTDETRLDSCTTCHTAVPVLNPYGSDYLEAERDFAAIEPLDSDADGATNLDEIMALTFPGDATDVPEATATPTGPIDATATPTGPIDATPTPTLFPGLCPGDCGGDGEVTVDELITAINIALGELSIEQCPAADVDTDGQVTIGELIAAVNAALEGCVS